MASSRLFGLLQGKGLSILRPTPIPKFNIIISSSCVCLPHSLSLRFQRYSSTASSSLTLDSHSSSDDASTTTAHPWPEWVDFVNRLKAKGYITQNDSAAAVSPQGLLVYTDVKLVKDACLSFARDRFDVFKSLSTPDIQTIVEKGCPNLFRKAVNSAKRLRAYLELDEGDVCSSCNLRGSCDRAYVMLNDSEAAARTVDVVRILLLYALDPLVISGENKPPGRELVESSARKLLSELVELGERPPDPDLPKPAPVSPQRKKQSLNLSDNESSKSIDMKPGDWVCTKCNFMNFARNVRCLKCNTGGPKSVFTGGVEMKKGDWNCSECSFMNFASNTQCFRCQAPRPQRELRPGDWECPDCDFLNFSRNTVCKRCNLDRPVRSAAQNYEQTWKRPY